MTQLEKIIQRRKTRRNISLNPNEALEISNPNFALFI